MRGQNAHSAGCLKEGRHVVLFFLLLVFSSPRVVRVSCLRQVGLSCLLFQGFFFSSQPVFSFLLVVGGRKAVTSVHLHAKGTRDPAATASPPLLFFQAVCRCNPPYNTPVTAASFYSTVEGQLFQENCTFLCMSYHPVPKLFVASYCALCIGFVLAPSISRGKARAT